MNAILTRRVRAAIVSSYLCLIAAGSLRAGDALDQWHLRKPQPQGNRLANVVWVNNHYLAVGEMGTLLTSTDGTNWISKQSTTMEWLRDCAYGNGMYVAVGDYGTILSSPNGVDWTSQFGGTFYSLNAVAFSNDRFVAVGAGGTILTSEDGQNWTLRAVGPWIYYDVIYAENMFVAGGQSNIVTSADGITWVRSSLVGGGIVHSLAHGDGKFLAATLGASSPEIWKSDDGLNWQYEATINTYYILTLAYGGGNWVATARYEDDSRYGYFGIYGPSVTWVSADAHNWTPATTNGFKITGVTYGNAQFVAACLSGEIFWSKTGTNWLEASGNTPAAPLSVSDMIYANGSFVGVGRGNVTFSKDGREWANAIVITNGTESVDLFCVAYGNGRYVAGSSSRRIYTSTDGLAWTNPAPELSIYPYAASVAGVAYGKGLFVGVGGYTGDVLSSSDGLSWNVQSVTTNTYNYWYWSDLVFGKDRFVAVGDRGITACSSDGLNWKIHETDPSWYLLAIAYGNGRFVAVGGELIVTSLDGTNWTQSSVIGAKRLADVGFGGGFFLATGYDIYARDEAPIWVSRDGLNWSRRQSGTRRALSTVAYGDGTFVISSVDGAILQSNPFLNLSFDLISGTHLTVTGPNDRRCAIESTESLAAPVTWRPETEVLMEGGAATIVAPSFTSAAHRFYRARLLP